MTKPLQIDHLDKLPRCHRAAFIPKIAKRLLMILGWQITGELPNVSQAVLIAAPHTSNYDGVPGILTMLALDLDIKVLGKKQLFAVPILSQFLRWAGVIPIDRDKKGSVLQANIDRFATGRPLLLALAPEGTRNYTQTWKSGFYYLAVGAGVPIIPVVLNYGKKCVDFMPVFYPTGDYEKDLQEIVSRYQGVMGKHPTKVSQIIQDA